MRIIRIKNNDIIGRTWVGQAITTGSYYTVPDSNIIKWSNDEVLLGDITSGSAIINDGDKDLGVNDGISWLKGINTALASDRSLKIQQGPLEGSRFTVISCNWCDKTTWYNTSVRDIEVLSSSDNLIYSPLTASHRVDVTHGKITGERNLRSVYAPVVLINGIAQAEHSPETTDGAFNYNYLSGTVTFTSSLQPSDVVETSSSLVVNSSFVVKPAPGKKIRLTEVEVQFSEDIGLTDTVLFQPYGKVNDFAPQYTPTPYPSGTLIPLGNPVVYQTMHDYINEANLSYPVIPALGGSNWRAGSTDVHIFRWDYKATTDLDASRGMEIRVSLESNTEFSGTFAVATFYGLSINE